MDSAVERPITEASQAIDSPDACILQKFLFFDIIGRHCPLDLRKLIHPCPGWFLILHPTLLIRKDDGSCAPFGLSCDALVFLGLDPRVVQADGLSYYLLIDARRHCYPL